MMASRRAPDDGLAARQGCEARKVRAVCQARVRGEPAGSGGVSMFYEPSADPAARPFPIDPFKSLVVPRPIGWVTTLDIDGTVNLAPFSFFNAFGDTPPVVAFGPQGRKPDRPVKDSLANVEATGDFVCNLATYDLRERMNLTATHFPMGVDEMKQVGLTPVPSRLVKPPRVAESPAHLECRYLQTVELPSWNPDERQTMVLGQVVGIHIDDGLIRDGRVDIVAARPIARLGYSLYATVDGSFRMPFPDWEQFEAQHLERPAGTGKLRP